MVNKFSSLYPTFIYKSFSLEKNGSSICAAFNFSIEGLCDFSPRITVETANLKLVNGWDDDTARRIIFCLGMVEAVSYFKAVCPQTVRVECGELDAYDAGWFKKLWFNGLGEFFYVNGMNPSEADFLSLEAPAAKSAFKDTFNDSGLCLIPVGGGKDSCVTAELLRAQRDKNLFLTVNDQPARTECVLAAGYGRESIVRVSRTIDKNLLDLNARGFYNGHTPFSAIVAFVSLYCAYITGSRFIALSNESSANEGNTAGGVNHQYSKSFEFERDFSDFVSKNITGGIKYFSLLRPFNELQIAKYFARTDKYLDVFRSCNRGSKTNTWCGSCPKCLFVYGMLSPFVQRERLIGIFGSDLFAKPELNAQARALAGLGEVKPFECVGTAEEFLYAVCTAAQQLKAKGKPLPQMLEYLGSLVDIQRLAADKSLLYEYNGEHLVPGELLYAVTEMTSYVSACD